MTGENNTYYKDNLITLYNKDCKDMSELEGNSIDLIVTDPPYGISFMGKDWDKALPDKQIWSECLRVLKDGAFAFVMCIPRADCLSRMIISLEDAGFAVNFTPIYHAFASGFPKAENVAKVILKRFLQVSLQDVSHSPYKDEDCQSDCLAHCRLCGGLLQNGQVIFRDASPLTNDVPEYNRLSSPSVEILVDNEHKYKVSYASLSFHHTTQDLKPLASWQTIVSSVLQSKPSDWLPQFSADNWGLENKSLLPHGFGQHDNISKNSNVFYENETGVLPMPDKSEIADGNTHKSTQSYLYYNRYCPDCQEQMSNKLSELQGSYAGMQVKPAVEIILVAQKPLSEKTFVDQALKNRKGISWLDDCRIPYEQGGSIASNPLKRVSEGHTLRCNDWGQGAETTKDKSDIISDKGRFPANLLVSNDVLNDGRDIITHGGGRVVYGGCFGGKKQNTDIPIKFQSDSGSFSRYFDLDKWAQKTFPFLIVPKASKSEKNKGLEGVDPQQVNDGRNKLPDNAFQRGQTYRHNQHPTVKPLKLMSYLITLGSRKGDTILDPFVGSGTTCLAAKLLNRKSIGYEISPEYCKIATNRCRQMILEM